jgi:hypothetical protein
MAGRVWMRFVANTDYFAQFTQISRWVNKNNASGCEETMNMIGAPKDKAESTAPVTSHALN